MVCGIGRTAQNLKGAVLVGVAVAAALVFAVPVRATDTVVQSIVNSGTQPVPALAVPGVTSTVKITTLPFQLQGTVVNLSQIRVYIDDVFSVTIPLAQGMTTFSDNLVFSKGTHVVRLVGISPYANISPTVSFTLTYTPPVIDSTVPNEPSNENVADNENSTNSTDDANVADNPTTTTRERFGGATISQQASSTQLTTPLPSVQQTTLPDWLYGALVALDIARPGTSTVSWPMVQRFSVMTAGLSALLFASVLLSSGRKLLYNWAGSHRELVMCPVHYHSKGYIRGFGLALILFALIFV